MRAVGGKIGNVSFKIEVVWNLLVEDVDMRVLMTGNVCALLLSCRCFRRLSVTRLIIVTCTEKYETFVSWVRLSKLTVILCVMVYQFRLSFDVLDSKTHKS